MARYGRLLIPLVLLVAAHVAISANVWSQRLEKRTVLQPGYVLPVSFSRILALDYKSLYADFMLAKVINFYGGRALANSPMVDDDWTYIVNALAVVIDLDPYAQDPYLLTESLLPWDGQRVEEANRLLEVGMRHRTTDWQIPFFIGFNHFYFLKDNQKAADILMQASKIPGSPEFLTPFAARLAHQAGKSATAVGFLKGVLAQTADPRVRANLERRLLALEGAATIEGLVEKFKNEHGRLPDNVAELVSQGLATQLPKDPYGGEWTITESGGVESTSRFSDNN